MAMQQLMDFLDQERIHYKSIQHPQTFTAQRTAQAIHVKGKEMAKTLIVKIDGQNCMVVMPAHCRLNIEKMKEATGAESIMMTDEREFSRLFPQCEIGAMPPFGNLFGMEVYAQEELAKDNEIAFNAGTHTEALRIPYSDFEKTVHPHTGDFCC